MSCGPDNLEEVGAQSVRPSDSLAGWYTGGRHWVGHVAVAYQVPTKCNKGT